MQNVRNRSAWKMGLLSLGFCLSFLFLVTFNGCTGPQNLVLVNRVVAVAAGGGGSTLFFSGISGQTIRITLTGSSATMEPYGHLEPPGGTAVDTPPNGAAQNGVNTADVTLTETGQFSFTVFDGSNQGGNVTVRVEVLSG